MYKLEKWDKTTSKHICIIGFYPSKEEAKKKIKGYREREDLNTTYMTVYTRKGSKYMYFLVELGGVIDFIPY